MRQHSFSLRKKLALSALIAAAFAMPRAAPAQTWTGAVDNDWNDAGNWSALPAPGGSLIFSTPGIGPGAGLTLNNDLTNAGFDVNGITFDALAGAYVISGNEFNLTNGVTNNSTALQTLNTNFSVSAAQIFNAVSGSMTLGGVISGAGGITKQANETLTLTNANLYNGVTTITTGELRITNGAALGSTTGGTTVASGGALELEGSITVGNEAITINGGGVSFPAVTNAGAIRNISGDNIYGGTVTLGSQSRINSDAGTLTLNNATAAVNGAFTLVVGGAGNVTITTPIATTAGGVTKDGAGTLTLSGVNTYVGATAVNVGVLRATTSASALGAGTLTLGGGQLQLANNTGLNFARNTTVSASSSITADRLASAATTTTHTLGTLSIGAQTLTINRGTNITGAGIGGITFGATTLTAGPAVFSTSANTNLTLGAVGGAFALTKQGAGQLTLGTTSTRTTAAGITNLSAGILRLNTGNALNTLATAPLNISGGTLSLGVTAGATYGGTATTVSGNSTVEADAQASTANVTQTLGTLSIGAQILTINRGANITGTGGVTFGAASQTAAATLSPQANALLTLGGTTGLSTFTLTKTGAGTLTLGGIVSGTKAVNTTALQINDGTVAVSVNTNTFNGNIDVAGATSVFQVATGATYTTTAPWGTVAGGTSTKQLLLTNGGTFRLNSGSLNVNNITTANIGAGIIFNFGTGGGVLDIASGATLIIDDGTATGTGVGAAQIQGAGSITKTGLGLFQQDDSTAFAGDIIIAAGTFQPASANAGGAPSAGTSIQSGAQYNVNGIGVTNPEPLTINSTGLASLPQGALTNLSANSGSFAGPITLGSNATIGTGAAGNITVSGGVTGAFNLAVNNQAAGGTILSTATVNHGGTLTNSGTGTGPTLISAPIGTNVTNIIQNSATSSLTLSNNASIAYTGTTTVSVGILNITGYTAAPTTTALTVAGGATLNLVSIAGQTTNLGAGALNLGGVGTTTLGFGLGVPGTNDKVITTGTATTAGAIALNLYGLSGLAAGTYPLLTASSGALDTASYAITSVPGGFTAALSTSPGLVQVTTTPVAGGADLYWRGSVNGSWSGISGANTNWDLTSGGTSNAGYNPASSNRVIFGNSNATGPAITTTLENSYSILDLEFTSAPSGVTSVAIAPGTLPTNSLTITPTATTDGISVAANAGAVTISAPVVLGAPQTWSADGTGANGSSLTVSGPITGSGANSLTINGLVTLSNPNSPFVGPSTYSGTTTVPSGAILQGGATNSFSANSTMTVNGTGIVRLNGFNNTVASLAGTGTVENSHVSANITLTAGGDNSSTTFSGIIQNGGVGTMGLTKTGTGALTLSAASTHTGNTIVRAGTLNISGTGSLTGNTTATRLQLQPTASGESAIVNYTSSGTSTFFSVNGANVAGTASVFNQSNGIVQISPNATTDTQSVVTATGAYGAYNISGGTFRDTTGVSGGSRFTVSNVGTASATNGTITGVRVGIVNVSGTGFIDHTNAEWWLNYSLGQINVTDSGKIDHTGSNNPFALFMDTTVVGGSYGVLNLAGTGAQVITGAQSIRFGNNASNGSGNSGFVNLAAGTLSTGTIATTFLPVAPSATNYIYYNYAGGTLKATGTLATGWTPTSGASATVINTIYGPIDNVGTANDFLGGLTVDTNGNPVTIPAAQPLLAATGVGVTQADLTVGGGTGYISAPSVTFSRPVAAAGVAAAGYAVVSGGVVTGIVITNPGVYASGETPTIQLLGGFAAGAGTAATVTSSALATNNTSGGLTKTGAGILTLSGAGNTYTAGTIVNEGTLALGVNGGLPTNGNLTITGTGIFDAATFTNSVGTVSLQSGGISGSTGVITSNANYDLRSGTVSFTDISGGFAGAVNVNKSTPGTVTLANKGLGSFANAVNITAGTLAFSANDQLGNASATNTLSVNGAGATLSYTGSTSTSLAANQVLTIGSSGGTLNASDPGGVLNLVGGVTTASAANLTKTGLGTIAVTGSTNLNGGNVTVSAGVLNAGFTPTGLGGISVANGGTLNLYDGAVTTMAINALTLNNGSSLGFDLNAPTVNDVLNLTGTAIVSPTVSLNFNNLGGLAAGTYDLVNVTAGTLNNTNYVLGVAPSGFNYSFSTVNSNQTLRLTTSALTQRYWTGDQDGNWNTNSGPGNTNWASDASGATELAVLPAATDTLVFSGSSAVPVAGLIATSLNNVPVTADSLRFISAPTTPATTDITIASGGASGILTINPASSNNGIFVAASGGNVAIAAPVVAQSNQNWEVNGTSPSSLTVSGNVTFTGNVTKTGAGVLTLSGTNTGAGGFDLSDGTLNLAANNALGTGTFNVAPGTTLDATGGPRTLNNGAYAWNGNYTFTGSNNLDLGSSAVMLGGSMTLTASGSTLTVGGVIDDGASTFGITKAGAGTLALNNANTLGGGVTLNAGTLNLGNAAAMGTGTFTINGGTFDNTSGSAATVANPLAINSSFTFTGSNALSLTGAATMAAITPTITVAGSTLTLGSSLTGIVGLTKDGAGALTLNGNSAYSGVTTVNGGTLNINGAMTGNGAKVFNNSTVNLAGSFTGTGNTTVNLGTLNLSGSLVGNATTTTLAYGTTAGNTIVNHSGTFSGFIMTGANVAGSNAVFNQTAGSVTIVPPNGQDQQYLANNGGYGMLNISGGTFNTGRFDGTGATGTASTAAVIYVGGTGTLNQNTGDWFLPIRSNGMMSMTIAPGGTFTRQNATTAQFSIIGLTGTNTYGVFNVAGGTVDTGSTKGLNFSQTSFSPGTGNVGFVNAAGGTLSLGLNTAVGAAAGLTNGYFNFAGATIKANAALTAVIPASTANYVFTSTVYGPITNNNNANTAFNTQVGTSSNFTGGMVVDTNGFAVSFTNALLGATGTGVTQANIGNMTSLGGNTGYVGAPLVQFAAPASGGVPASGYALYDSGQVTGIVVTNPGVYASGETPLVTLTGGGGTIAPFNLTALNTANTSGGLTKLGAGTLTLSGVNTFTGPTTINASSGTLAIGGAGQLGAGNYAGAVSIGTGSTFQYDSTVAQTLSGLISGAGNLTKSNTGTLTVSGANSGFTGPVGINGGIISVITNNNALGSGTVTFNGGVRLLLGDGISLANPIVLGPNAGTGGNGLIQYAGATSATASGPITINNGAAAGGHFASTSTGVLNLTGVITSSAQVSQRTGTVMYSGGGTGYASMILTGTSIVGANDGLATTATVTLGGSGNSTVDLNGFNQSLAGITRNGSTTIIGNSSTTADSTLTITGTSTYSGTIVDVIGAGTRKVNLTKSVGGVLTLSGANTYTGMTTVSAGDVVVTGSLANNSSAHILMAAPDDVLAGNPVLTRAVPAAVNAYAGFGSKVTAASIDPITTTALQTTSDILMSNTNADIDNMSMQWRQRTALEAAGSNPNAVLSDVVSVTGMDNGADIFVLQMSYNDAALNALNLNEASIAISGELRLGWKSGPNPTDWTTATVGNVGSAGINAVTNFQGSWVDFITANPGVNSGSLNTYLGSRGVDTVSNTVWAIVDHNSEFAVIPEPSTLVLGGLALLGFAGMGLRRRRMMAK